MSHISPRPEDLTHYFSMVGYHRQKENMAERSHTSLLYGGISPSKREHGGEISHITSLWWDITVKKRAWRRDLTHYFSMVGYHRQKENMAERSHTSLLYGDISPSKREHGGEISHITSLWWDITVKKRTWRRDLTHHFSTVTYHRQKENMAERSHTLLLYGGISPSKRQQSRYPCPTFHPDQNIPLITSLWWYIIVKKRTWWRAISHISHLPEDLGLWWDITVKKTTRQRVTHIHPGQTISVYGEISSKREHGGESCLTFHICQKNFVYGGISPSKKQYGRESCQTFHLCQKIFVYGESHAKHFILARRSLSMVRVMPNILSLPDDLTRHLSMTGCHCQKEDRFVCLFIYFRSYLFIYILICLLVYLFIQTFLLSFFAHWRLLVLTFSFVSWLLGLGFF